jgi:hypothetical protein
MGGGGLLVKVREGGSRQRGEEKDDSETEGKVRGAVEEGRVSKETLLFSLVISTPYRILLFQSILLSKTIPCVSGRPHDTLYLL